MCDPATMAMMAKGAKAGGGLLGAYGKLVEGHTAHLLGGFQADMYGANARILSKQAEMAELGADFAFSRARVNESRVREAGEDTLAAQRTWYASNYLDPAYGSPMVHQAMTAGQVEADVDLIRATAAIEAADAISRGANLRIQSASQIMNAELSRFKGSAARMAGYIGAGTALLSSAG